MSHNLSALSAAGLLPVLEAALLRYKRDGQLGKSRPSLTALDWEALARLTGEKPNGVLDLALLDAALRRSRYAASLPDVLAELQGGPVIPARKQREMAAGTWEYMVRQALHVPWRRALEAGAGGANMLRLARKKGEDVEGIVRVVSAALDFIAVNGVTSFPILAAQLSGDAHVFDAHTLMGRVLRAAIAAVNLPSPERDGVSSTALCVNLRGPAWLDGAVGHVLALPLREIQKLDGLHTPNGLLWVVENPSVFEALHTAYPAAPLVCTSGQPTAAVTELLQRLAPNTTVFLSCDLDMGGLRIASFLRQNMALNWQNWRMDAAAYALARSRGTVELSGNVTTYGYFFPDLVQEMQHYAAGAHQENLLPELLADVATAGF